MQKTIKKLPKSQLAIDVVIPKDIFEAYRTKALTNAGEHVEIPGFRKGKAPLAILEKELSAMAILEEMANMAVNEHLPKVLVDEKIDALGRPEIMITKIAQGETLEFTATVAVLPEVTLPDYKKIAKDINKKDATELVVTDEELDGAIKELKKAREHDKIHKSGEEHNHEEFEKQEFDATLTEEYVKDLGPFESVEDFKNKFRENILTEKKARENEKNRIAILDAIFEKTETEIPEVLAQSELENLINRLKADISQAGIGFNDYLNHIKKTEDDIRTDLMPDAEKRAKMELIMVKIAEKESLKPKDEDIETETKRLIQTYQDADPLRARMYVAHMLTNEEIFRFLENQ